MSGQSKYRYWAKTTVDGKPGIEVFPHCRNVGFVAGMLARTKKQQIEAFNISAEEASLLAAMHDIGKCSPGFQSKCDAWLEQYNLTQDAKNKGWLDDGRCDRLHDRVSQFTAFNFFKSNGMPDTSADLYSAIIGSHHGRPHKSPSRYGLPEMAGRQKDEWEAARLNTIGRLVESLGGLPRREIKIDDPCLWWLAGLISISDWIGSDETFFDNSRNIDEVEGRRCAKEAIENIGFGIPKINTRLAFSDLFKLSSDGRISEPNALQLAAFEAITEPGIYAIEAPMGMGKTEAALWIAYNLISTGKANGLYFALPTQVTSNRIHLRVRDFIENICGQIHRVGLVHASSWLMEGSNLPRLGKTSKNEKPEQDARAGRDWFGSAKRALLAPFGVGTVDQALLATVAVKHFFIRRFALAGKVIIIDEVHSYDVYTGTLIKALCDDLEKLGCTIILLSATLTQERRQALLGINKPERVDDLTDPYPLITGRRSDQIVINPVSVTPPNSKKVIPSFKMRDAALDGAWNAANNGACVLWICNTIGEAQNIYEWFLQMHSKGTIEIGLLHSRFPYFRREQIEQEWMEKLGKNNRTRTGCILVSTQVVEQSVDLDADLLITELAPTDMLLQRIGRLWRHDRTSRAYAQPECWIIQPRFIFEDVLSASAGQIRSVLKPSSNVYHPYVLLRSWEVWKDIETGIAIPGDIRGLLESTYFDRDDEPESWQNLRGTIEGERYAQRMRANMNTNVWQLLPDDIEGVKTRLSGQETASLILASDIADKNFELINGDKVTIDPAKYQVSVARALHRNLVKVPAWVFAGVKINESIHRYVFGKQTVVKIAVDGRIVVDGLKEGIELRYSPDYGLRIISGESNEYGL